jgi:hypothetical protein
VASRWCCEPPTICYFSSWDPARPTSCYCPRTPYLAMHNCTRLHFLYCIPSDGMSNHLSISPSLPYSLNFQPRSRFLALPNSSPPLVRFPSLSSLLWTIIGGWGVEIRSVRQRLRLGEVKCRGLGRGWKRHRKIYGGKCELFLSLFRHYLTACLVA